MRDEMITLERRCRMLLRAYPAGYRRHRAEEMVGTLLDTAPAGRAWPPPRDIMALLLGGLRARGGLDQRVGTRANLRMAALLGCAVYLSFIALTYASYGLVPVYPQGHGWFGHGVGLWWPPVIAASVILAAGLLPWFASRKVVALGAAVAAGTAAVAFTLWGRPVLVWSASPGLQLLAVLVPLAAIVLLSDGRQRPPRLWLWLPGLVIALVLFAEIASIIDQPTWLAPTPDPYLLWLLPLAVVVAWFAIDARPAVALAVYFGLWSSQSLIEYWQFRGWDLSFVGQLEWSANPWAGSPMWFAAVLALTVLALWRVRRQAVL